MKINKVRAKSLLERVESGLGRSRDDVTILRRGEGPIIARRISSQ